MPDQLTYCEDCKFCDAPNGEYVFARCAHSNASKTATPDRFVARRFDKPAYASTMRSLENKCGPRAEWFERYEPKPIPVKLPESILRVVKGWTP